MRAADHWATEADLLAEAFEVDRRARIENTERRRETAERANQVGAAERAENHRGRRLCSDKVAAPTTLNDTSEKSETAASSR